MAHSYSVPGGDSISAMVSAKRSFRLQTARELVAAIPADGRYNFPLQGSSCAPGLPLIPSMGPLLRLQQDFAAKNKQWIILALQSGVRSEVVSALNALTLLAFTEKESRQRDKPLLGIAPEILDSLLHLVGNEGSNGMDVDHGIRDPEKAHALRESKHGTLQDNGDSQADWWVDDETLKNYDPSLMEKELARIAASNILRTLSFIPENAAVMAANINLIQALAVILMEYESRDEELVTNTLDVLVNVAVFLDIRKIADFASADAELSSGRDFFHSLKLLLNSQKKAHHHGASEIFAKLLLNPGNEIIVGKFGVEVFPRLTMLLDRGDPEVQGAAVTALAAFSDSSSSCRVLICQQRNIIPRLLSVLKTPHPLLDVCRKAAYTLESLASEFRNRAVFMAYEQQIAELAMTENKCSEQLARVLWELSTDSSARCKTVWSVWTA